MGGPSRYACPECHDVPLELKDGERVRFRCHTGRALDEGALLLNGLASPC
jgi:two-component system chemotaxis response regulator CheB